MSGRAEARSYRRAFLAGFRFPPVLLHSAASGAGAGNGDQIVMSLLAATQARGIRSVAVRLRRTVAMQDDRSLEHRLGACRRATGFLSSGDRGCLRQVNMTVRTR